MTEPPTPQPLVEAEGLTKRFDGALALDEVDLAIRPGEVHGLLGENGSGKSTLIKILAGYHSVDGGRLRVRGMDVGLPLGPGVSRMLGLEFVHQDLGLIESLSVVENLRIAAMGDRRLRISWRDERRRASQVFERYGFELDPRATVAEIRPVQRAQLAIARAVEGMPGGNHGQPGQGGLLVLDEPTVFLPRDEVTHLFALVREIVASGSSVLFVSHDIDEVCTITDRVTVLRDGRRVGTVVTAETDDQRLVEMIIGRRLGTMPAATPTRPSSPGSFARVSGLRGGQLDGVNLTVGAGEVLGLTGLLGSGFEDVVYFLFGAQTPEAGQIELAGNTHDLVAMKPKQAMQAGMALIPGDRQNDGSVPTLSVTDNVMMPVLDEHMSKFGLQRRAMVRGTASLMEQYDVRPRDPRLPYSTLSGGNQQKALIAKWLQTGPSLLLVHEPTQGVDVGARQQIFNVLRQSAAGGRAVICASADHEQLATICDRVLVLGRGRVVSELEGDDVSKDRITEQCFSSSALAEALSPALVPQTN